MWPLTGLEIVNVCAGACTLPELFGVHIAGVVADGTRPRSDDLFVALREPAYDFDGHDWVNAYLRAGAALALVSVDWPALSTLEPSLRRRCIVVEDSLRALTQLAGWLRRRFPFPVVAVGGSNGKTTTKEMLAALLSAPPFRVTRTPGNLNGTTGIPLTLAQREHAHALPPHALIVEIGIDRPNTMADHASLIRPDVAVITALGPEHLAGFGSWETAIAEELLLFESSPTLRRIFQAKDVTLRQRIGSARRGDIVVCDEDLLQEITRCIDLARSEVGLLTYRTSDSSSLSTEVEMRFYADAARRSACTFRGAAIVPMAGRHNADNFAAAFAAGLAIGRSAEDLLRGWPNFRSPAMRCQGLALPDGGILIDDSYNASPSSMAAALALLESPEFVNRRKLLLLGDMLDLGEFSSAWHRALCEPLRALKNAQLFLFGDAMCEVHRQLGATANAVSLPTAADPRVFLSHSAAAVNDAVILIKGSRGMRLDRVVDAVLRRSDGPAESRSGERWQLQFSIDESKDDKH